MFTLKTKKCKKHVFVHFFGDSGFRPKTCFLTCFVESITNWTQPWPRSTKKGPKRAYFGSFRFLKPILGFDPIFHGCWIVSKKWCPLFLDVVRLTNPLYAKPVQKHPKKGSFWGCLNELKMSLNRPTRARVLVKRYMRLCAPNPDPPQIGVITPIWGPHRPEGGGFP